MNDIGFLDGHYSCLAGQQGAANHHTSIKHAFVLSFYFMLRSIKHHDMNIYYEKVLRETVKLGGDTDGNACIVAGLIGALVGVRRLPVEMITTLLAFDDGASGQNRKGRFCVRESTLKSIDELIDVRPREKLLIK